MAEAGKPCTPTIAALRPSDPDRTGQNCGLERLPGLPTGGFPPMAQPRFVRKHRLTRGAMAYASALILAGVLWAGLKLPRAPQPLPAHAQGVPALLRAWDRETAGAFRTAPTHSGRLAFPGDHGAHADHPFEVWELAARLNSDRPVSWFRLRIVRIGAAPNPPPRSSAWAAHEFIRSELTLGRIEPRPSVANVVRSSRAALGVAGHTADPPKLWIDGDTVSFVQAAGDPDTVVLDLHESGLTGRLRFAAAPPLVDAAERELAGTPWRGYSYPRMAVSGELASEQATEKVTGSGWLLHQWGGLPPVGGQLTFDRWFMQFDQGGAMAVLRMRRRDGSAPPVGRGFLIGADGRVDTLGPDDLRVGSDAPPDDPEGSWDFAAAALSLRADAEVARGQAERNSGDTGLSREIRVKGMRNGRPVTGWGIVELGGF